MNPPPTLAQHRLLLTRSASQSEELARLVQAWGGIPLICPTIEIQPLADYQAVDERLQQLSQVDWLVFTSRNGVHYCQQRCQYLDIDLSAWPGKIAVIGPGSAQALQIYWQREPDLLASPHVAATLAWELVQTGVVGKSILCLRAVQARPELVTQLQHAGAVVIDQPMYQTVLPSVPFVTPTQPIDYVTFASASAVQHFAEMVSQTQEIAWLNQAKIAAIGPITAQAAVQYVGRVDVVAEVHTLAGLLTAIAKDISRAALF